VLIKLEYLKAKIKELIAQSGDYSPEGFALALGLSGRGGYYDFINKRKKVSSEDVAKIAAYFGKDTAFFIQESHIEETPIEVIKELQERIRTLEDTIQDLRLNNKSLRNAVESLGESNKTFNQIIQKNFIKGKAS
jgi:plasmid maintenance system antidote protein VapI